jgi:AcrR family transcriptional regulator
MSPKSAPLNAERIAREALALIDEEGVAAFTLDRLAVRLGVRAPSLYNHVASKAAIIEGVRDLVVAEMDYSMFDDRAWDVALEAFARSYREAFAAHPNTVALLYTTPVRAAATYRMYETVAVAMKRAGWPAPLIIPIVAALEYLIAGSVLDRAALGMMFEDAAALGAPTVAESQAAVGSQVEVADDTFEFGLTSLLDGLRARYAVDPRVGA